MTIQTELPQFHWLNQPERYSVETGILKMTTDPGTDFWQRTYYGFRNNNAHAYVLPVANQEFSFTVKTSWQPQNMYDQCGIVLYQDADNWMKASVEYENLEYSRLGSVVTNLGYSDWSTTDVDSSINTMFYRLSRRGQDFLIENSEDGRIFKQMRIFHMHLPIVQANTGVYACSPLNSSIQAVFSDFEFTECIWKPYQEPDA